MPEGHAPGFQRVPDYPMVIEDFRGRVRASVAGIVLADSENVKLMLEGQYPGVFYFPMADVRIDGFLRATDHRTTCPFKGDASYWSFSMGDRLEENIAWGYMDPYDEAASIKGHVAFYWDRMDVWFLDDDQITAPPG